jgi:D-alanyl-D-alanine carboxypeptidase
MDVRQYGIPKSVMRFKVAFGAKAGAGIAAAFLLFAFPGQAAAGPSLLIEADGGKVIVEDRAGMPWYPASLTKLMTAYLTFTALREGRLKLDQKIPVSWLAAQQPPSKIGIAGGGQVSVDFALQALLVHSANDMAVVLAEAVGKDLPSFVVAMNKAAKALGMSGSRFLNPHGLHDPNHVSTARDLALLAKIIYEKFPEYRHYFAQDHVAVGKRRLVNTNRLLRQMAEADGMKTGYVCAAGFNLIGSALIGSKKLIAVVLGASSGASRADWAQTLLGLGATRAARSETVSQIANAPPGTEAPDLTKLICEGGRGLSLTPVAQAKGHGVSLGPFANREEGLKALRLWSDSGDAYLKDASKGLVRPASAKTHRALVWDLDEGEARALCAFVKERSMACEVMTPDRLQVLARQAEAEAKARPRKKAKGKRKRKKKA